RRTPARRTRRSSPSARIGLRPRPVAPPRLQVQFDVPLVCGNAGRDRVWPADPLKPRRDLGVIQVWIVTAVAADELKRVGVAAFRLAFHDAGRLAPQNGRPAMPWLITGLHTLPPFAITAPGHPLRLAERSCGTRHHTAEPALRPARASSRRGRSGRPARQ